MRTKLECYKPVTGLCLCVVMEGICDYMFEMQVSLTADKQ